jgi:hypothetical protein
MLTHSRRLLKPSEESVVVVVAFDDVYDYDDDDVDVDVDVVDDKDDDDDDDDVDD